MRKILLTIIMALALMEGYSQRTFTREEVMGMTQEELGELPFEELLTAMDVLGVKSMDELYSLLLNKTVSSASKSEESAFTAPLSTTTITKDEIIQWGCSSIEEALRLVSGVTVAQKTNGNYDVQIRGLNNITEGQRLLYTENFNTKLLLNGRDLTDYVSGALLFEMLPIGLEDIKSIEVVRGPISSMYGVNAVNGIINILTEKPYESQEYLTSGTIQTSFDLGTTVASAMTRMVFNDKVSGGISLNLEKRDRTTDMVYIPGTKDNYYISEQDSTMVAYQGGWIKQDDLHKIYSMSNGMYIPSSMAHVDNMSILSGDPELAKKMQAVNGYLSLNLGEGDGIDLTMGYNKTKVNTSTLDDALFSIGGRYNQGGYVNVTGQVGGLGWVLNFDKHSNSYNNGAPGYQVDVTRLGGEVDYTIHLLSKRLHLRPIFEFTGYLADDKKATYTKEIEGEEYIYSSFFGRKVETYTLSPSIMASYKDRGWKFNGSMRLDCTTNPSRRNLNFNASICREINEDNFIRLSYGRASRGAVLTNTSVDYTIDHKSIGQPSYIHLMGSEHDLMSLDGIEIGYRTRPSSKMLLDIEAYGSLSKDYGALKTNRMFFTTSADQFMVWIQNALGAYATQGAEGLTSFISTQWPRYYDTHSVFEYGNVPFTVKQIGLSINMDYILNKYIALKANLNTQSTIIDNHYDYSQKGNIAYQIAQCINTTPDEYGINKSVAGFTTDILSNALAYSKVDAMINGWEWDGASELTQNSIRKYMMECTNAPAQLNQKWGHLSKNEIKKFNEAFVNHRDYVTSNGESVPTDELVGAYYGLMYGIDGNNNKGFTMASTNELNYTMKDGYKHKACPSFFGSFGVIVRPMDIINFSALLSFMSEREYKTSFGREVVPAFCNLNIKLGWTPSKNVEFFIQGHNLLSDGKVEFVYGDKSKTMFSTGLSCKF